MSKPAPISPAPAGYSRLIPRIFTDDPAGLVEFICAAFGAVRAVAPGRPTELRWGDSVLMVADTGSRRPQSAFLYLYVADVDGAYRRAIEGGATSVEEPKDQPYGDRRAMIQDPWGNTWQVATTVS